jgi:hypothetical protein
MKLDSVTTVKLGGLKVLTITTKKPRRARNTLEGGFF